MTGADGRRAGRLAAALPAWVKMPERNRNIVIRGFRPLWLEINLGLFSRCPSQVASSWRCCDAPQYR